MTPEHTYMPCLLTITTTSATLKHKAIGDWAVSAQVQKVPLATDNRGDVPGNDEQIVAQMKCGQTSFQLSTRQDRHLKTVYYFVERARERQKETKSA